MSNSWNFDLTHERGRFMSQFEEWPGYIQLPYPFLGKAYKRWLVATREFSEFAQVPLKDLAIDDLPVFNEWKAALTLVEFHLMNVDEFDFTDPSGDTVPMIIQSWVRQCVTEYMAEQLDLKN